MNSKLTDKQLLKLLETMAKAHMVEFMQNLDNSELEELIQFFAKWLEDNNKKEIFDKVFMEMKR